MQRAKREEIQIAAVMAVGWSCGLMTKESSTKALYVRWNRFMWSLWNHQRHKLFGDFPSCHGITSTETVSVFSTLSTQPEGSLTAAMLVVP